MTTRGNRSGSLHDGAIVPADLLTPQKGTPLLVHPMLRWPNTVKVAEHSFSARFCRCKLARAQGFQKPNMPSTERSFYLLKTRTICVIILYNCMQCIDGSSILLQRYVTKGNDAKNPAFLAFVCYRKNPVKCNACAVARKIETDCFSRNVPFSSDPVVRISRNLAKNRSETTGMIYHEKYEF